MVGQCACVSLYELIHICMFQGEEAGWNQGRQRSGADQTDEEDNIWQGKTKASKQETQWSNANARNLIHSYKMFFHKSCENALSIIKPN